jgi:predicted amidophosphoribosyltransferase
VPIHPTRLKGRGFNQTLEIAKVITKNCPEKFDYKSSQRQRYKPPQARLRLKVRVKISKVHLKLIQNRSHTLKKCIAIVDDVITTGVSLNELAKTLKQAGTTHVECWVIARTLSKH